MKRFLSLTTLVFAIGFALGAVVFFPIQKLKNPIAAALSKAAPGVTLTMGRLSIGTGLGLGLGVGGLLAITADNVYLTLPGDRSLDCANLKISPQLLPLFLAKSTVGFGCRTKNDGWIYGVLSASPIWAPKKAQASVRFSNLNLNDVEGLTQAPGAKGVLTGELMAKDINLGRMQELPEIEWSIVASKVETPQVSGLVKVPSLKLGTLETKGSLQKSRLRINPLKFGNREGNIEGDFKVDFELDSMMAPIGGDLSGRMRTLPEFESTELKGVLNLDLLFGKVKDSGFREFKKPIKGTVISLLNPPEEL
jgi:type II secretion system protein N